METAEERQKREAAIAEFKARGKTVRQCPAGVARGTIARKAGETYGEYVGRDIDKRAETGLLKPRMGKRRGQGQRLY